MLVRQKADFVANIGKTVLFNGKISLMDTQYIFIPLNYIAIQGRTISFVYILSGVYKISFIIVYLYN